MFKIFNADEWQFITNQELMETPLDKTHGAKIHVTLYSAEPVTVYLRNSDRDEKLLLAKDTHVNLEVQTLNFDYFAIESPAENDYAVKLFLKDHVQGERNSGEAVVLEVGEVYNARLEREVQMTMIRQLASAGFGTGEIQDILDGLNSDEDYEFEDDDALPTEAEMDDMIAMARENAAEPLTEPTTDPDDSTPADDDKDTQRPAPEA